MGNERFAINMGYPLNFKDVTKQKDAALNIAPNPASSVLYVSYDGIQGAGNIRITDITGKTLYKVETSDTQNKMSIPLDNLQDGIYIIEITSENSRITKKFIKR